MSGIRIKSSKLEKIINEELNKVLSKEKIPTIEEMETVMQKWIAYENRISLNQSTGDVI